ncbi:MAG: hypothetical protein LBK13_02700, partial [Spirochaetales bacterium]|nr:hypothetical protein [Spirochaetales bacterium]
MKDNIIIDDISTSDCNILNTIITKDCIKILFEYVYNIESKCVMENKTMIIKNWKEFKNIKYISKDPFDKDFDKIISNEYKE